MAIAELDTKALMTPGRGEVKIKIRGMKWLRVRLFFVRILIYPVLHLIAKALWIEQLAISWEIGDGQEDD